MKSLLIFISTLALVPQSAAADMVWKICTPYQSRINCIVDGDTLWVRDEKMRLRGVDTPEMDGLCGRERRLAQDATELHLALIASGIVEINRYGHDRFGRTLVEISTVRGQVGPALVRAGLADIFGDEHRIVWCD